jgi:hypothetical protein
LFLNIKVLTEPPAYEPPGPTMEELNPLFHKLADLRERAATLRGYL